MFEVVPAATARRGVVAWFASVAALIGAMIAVGGITRLTQSGLSMVTWDPVMGAIPPLSHQAWLDAFARYQQFPQYRATFPDMDLAGFQRIFFWEYLHRLLGRGVGLAVLLPGLWLAARRELDRGLAARFAGMLALILSQGALGWFMVKSGLVDQPHVSHYRLAAHLGLALAFLAYVLWALFDELEPRVNRRATPRLRRAVHAFTALVCVQLGYGALTAGLRAGLGYNTFPRMYGTWLPQAALALRPLWLNALENPAGVQFIHRTLAWLVLTSAVALAVASARTPLSARQRRSLRAILALVLVQFALGVATLLWFVPVALASLHQLTGCLLFAAVVRANHAVRAPVAMPSAPPLQLRLVRQA